MFLGVVSIDYIFSKGYKCYHNYILLKIAISTTSYVIWQWLVRSCLSQTVTLVATARGEEIPNQHASTCNASVQLVQ